MLFAAEEGVLRAWQCISMQASQPLAGSHHDYGLQGHAHIRSGIGGATNWSRGIMGIIRIFRALMEAPRALC